MDPCSPSICDQSPTLPKSADGTLLKTAPEQTTPATMLNDQAYRVLADTLPQPVFFKNLESSIVYINSAMAIMFGRKPEDVVGKTDFDLFPKDVAEKYRADDLRVFTDRKPERIQESFEFKGRKRVIEVVKSPVLDANGGVIGLMGVIIDITEHKEALDGMQKFERELRQVWEDSLDGMRITDEEGIVIRVNSAFCRMVGKQQEELVGKPFTVIYDSAHPPAILAKHKKRFIERNVEPLFERELQLWNGERVWFELSNSFLEVPGEATHLLSIFRDISERKHAEEKLREFTSRLERSNRELQDFAYVASHDLQEPLRKISVFGDRVKAKYGDKLGAEGCDYLDRMQKAATRMQALINDLLTFSRVTSKSQPFVKVDLAKVVRDVMGDLEARIEQTGATIDVGSLPTIEAEPLHMRQLMQNLIGNALKFQKPGVKPYVRLDAFLFKEETAEIRAGAREMAQLTVSDNGIGFDEKYLDRIFQVFQRLHSRAEFEGTGMGLAITRKIVEHHKGQITAKSKPGEGATFIVILPVQHTKTEQEL